MVDRRSIQESGVRYFTEENDTGKQKLGEKIKQLIKTVWDAIVGIFKKSDTCLFIFKAYRVSSTKSLERRSKN